jgi:hypothetical protein
MVNPISRYGGKESAEYEYYSSEFSDGRLRHWASIYLQSSPIIRKTDIMSVLEFGGGRDTTRALSRHMGINHIDVDVNDRFFPDYKSEIMEYPFEGKQYDMVCTFQCLEHNPFDDIDELILHMLKFTKRYFYLSVPYRGGWMSFTMNIKLPKINFTKEIVLAPNWFVYPKINESKIKERVSKNPEQFHDPHWWEVGMSGLKKNDFIRKVEKLGVSLIESKHNPLFPYHYFMLFEK